MTFDEHYNRLTKNIIGEDLGAILELYAKDTGYISLLSWLEYGVPSLLGSESNVYQSYLAYCGQDDLPAVSKLRFTRYLTTMNIFLQSTSVDNKTIRKYVQKTHCPTCHQLLDLKSK